MKKFLDIFVFGNFFISLCAVGMVFSTYIVNNIPIHISPFTVFILFSTYILYNFHRHSFLLDYSTNENFIASVRKIKTRPSEIFFYGISVLGSLITLFYIHPKIYLFLIPMGILALLYTIPFIRSKKKRLRLLEFYSVKTFVLAIVWGLTTTVIPLVEENISLLSPFVVLQVFSRSLFVFALCIPFEMRDTEKDRINNVRTLPVVYGIKAARIIGISAVILELILHHFMSPISLPLIVALDASSLVALFLILKQNNRNGPYYYKLYVDGMMLLRFIFLIIAIRFA